MDPPPPPPAAAAEAVSKSAFLSWLTFRMFGSGDSRESAFLKAVAEGNVRRLWSLLVGIGGEMVNRMGEKDRAKLADMNIDGSGLLQVAANLGRIEVIRYFVEELGFDVNAGCLSVMRAKLLASAALLGEADAVRYLLEHGADPNKIDETGSVALHCAVKNGYEEVVRLLLASGARVDIAVAHGTPLHIAVSYGKTDVVKILLDHHADPNNTWSSGYPILTALHSTKHGLDESDSLECVKLIVKAGADVNYACPNTPVVVATTEGLTDCMKYLLQVHADPNIPDKQSRRTPIEIASSLRRRNHVEILFPFTSPVRAVTNWTVEGIITHGKSRCSMPKPNKVSEELGTPLVATLHATSQGLAESISLKCAGADVNFSDRDTPLVVAITNGLTDCIKYLLKAGANPNIPTCDCGALPIQLAASYGRRKDVELFPLTSSIRAMSNWTVEGILAQAKSKHARSKCSKPKV